MKKTPFNLNVEISKAWDWLWADNAALRASKDEWTRNKAAYLTASDLERRVKSAAAEIADGKPYGYYQNYGGQGIVRIYSGGNYTLLERCRRWLMGQVSRGILRADHPSGRHTSTGLRFRPATDELTAPEKKAAATDPKEKARQRFIRHYANEEGKKACCPTLKRTALFRAPRYTPKPTTDRTAVTCKKCLKILANLVPETAPATA